jgi:hypothetical protein
MDELRTDYIRHDVECGSYGRALMNIDTPTDEASGAAFDRAIAAHDREVAATALDKAADEFRSGQITGLFTGRDQYPREWLRQRADKIREGRNDA